MYKIQIETQYYFPPVCHSLRLTFISSFLHIIPPRPILFHNTRPATSLRPLDFHSLNYHFVIVLLHGPRERNLSKRIIREKYPFLTTDQFRRVSRVVSRGYEIFIDAAWRKWKEYKRYLPRSGRKRTLAKGASLSTGDSRICHIRDRGISRRRSDFRSDRESDERPMKRSNDLQIRFREATKVSRILS